MSSCLNSKQQQQQKKYNNRLPCLSVYWEYKLLLHRFLHINFISHEWQVPAWLTGLFVFFTVLEFIEALKISRNADNIATLDIPMLDIAYTFSLTPCSFN